MFGSFLPSVIRIRILIADTDPKSCIYQFQSRIWNARCKYVKAETVPRQIWIESMSRQKWFRTKYELNLDLDHGKFHIYEVRPHLETFSEIKERPSQKSILNKENDPSSDFKGQLRKIQLDEALQLK